jgi:hypothetical protein
MGCFLDEVRLDVDLVWHLQLGLPEQPAHLVLR